MKQHPSVRQRTTRKTGETPPQENSAQSTSAAAAPKESLDSTTLLFLGRFRFPSVRVAQRGFFLFSLLLTVLSICGAYKIRMRSVEQYGRLIHEFDPWFNYRATEYLSEHGWTAFFHWFDEMSWYPLGRPVGTTIYPGLQLTAVALHRTLNALGVAMSLNDVCVLIPAWFGALATAALALLTYEATQSMVSTALASAFFAIVPAHLVRSMTGAFDNECIAIAAMLLTFYLWVRALRCPKSWPLGLLAGLAYGYMVAAWGGFIFVINMVALHAGACALADWVRGTYSPGLLRAYTLFFVVGTAIATRVPPVGMTPFKSLEQLSALVVLVLLWCLHAAELLRARTKEPIRCVATLRLRAYVLCVAVAGLIAVAAVFAPEGFFRPLSSRVRALFVAHTRTGNPLVDSVAEHQPMGSGMYWEFLGITSVGWCLGTIFAGASFRRGFVPSRLFMLLFSATSYFFASKMSRLVLFTAPVACILSGFVFGRLIECAIDAFFWAEQPHDSHKKNDDIPADKTATAGTGKKRVRQDNSSSNKKQQQTSGLLEMVHSWPHHIVAGVYLIALVIALVFVYNSNYISKSLESARHFGNPYIVFSAQVRGKNILVSDYYDSYIWMKENTAEDARVLSWWDYGYQITGIANRTTLADGNTWNHEHIATIGKMLTSPVKEAHGLVRHVADYVYIWVGVRGGDLGKSAHIARIANSVFRDICADDDPLCRYFGFDGSLEKPTPSMRASLLYNLHEHNRTDGVAVDPDLFEEVYQSKYGLVRIFKVMKVSQASKAWIADRKNHKCSPPPDTWVCPGQFPPAPEIQAMLRKRINFKQLEDFGHDKKKDAYYQAYMAEMKRGG